MKKEKFIITGGAGFIGSALARELGKAEKEIVIYDNFSSGSKSNLRGVKCKIIKGDVRNFNTLKKAFKGAAYVLHLAAQCSVQKSVEDPMETFDINVAGSLNVLRAAKECGVKKVLLASSSAVYGNAKQGKIKESAKKAPLSPYGISKMQMEELAALFAEMYKLRTVCPRFFNVYGPGQNAGGGYPAVVPAFISNIKKGKALTVFGDGKQTRDFIFAEDVARACLHLLRKGKSGSAYNVGTGKKTPLLTLIKNIEKAAGKKAEIIFKPARSGDIKHSLADVSKLKKTGFKPKYDLAQSLKITADFYK